LFDGEVFRECQQRSAQAFSESILFMQSQRSSLGMLDCDSYLIQYSVNSVISKELIIHISYQGNFRGKMWVTLTFCSSCFASDKRRQEKKQQLENTRRFWRAYVYTRQHPSTLLLIDCCWPSPLPMVVFFVSSLKKQQGHWYNLIRRKTVASWFDTQVPLYLYDASTCLAWV
jgi:hypothetical protein